MYRIGCFRDDIIFLVYLYQRWIYRVDPKRVNEFGTSLESQTGLSLENNETSEGNKVSDGKASTETKKDR
ncbi:hypothetical protein KIN20_022541 [Parelaphostrongylus tenuis]|uniref:Cleft lip and palate associated transmembrane protein n=1 Tax=Parelaphostrongylus tenuis TaxID=148309 RepID=A0AAD5QWU2_PARTN|nr:hypothetical protein KIN20_022541 [Parelaphostrongylus tenuis]